MSGRLDGRAMIRSKGKTVSNFNRDYSIQGIGSKPNLYQKIWDDEQFCTPFTLKQMKNLPVLRDIEIRVNELDEISDYSYSEIFQIVCGEFDLDAITIAAELGCECPFGLIGYLLVEQ